MSKHQIFLVHGMGNFEKGWSISVQQLLRNAYSQYALPKLKGFDSDFQFVEVTYNNLFDELRALWQENAAAASAAFTGTRLESSAVEKLIGLADGATGDDFARTHVLDVAMFRFLKQVNENVATSVSSQILNRLNAFPQNDIPSWSVISHSLGTAVMHETLHAMFTQPVNGSLLGDRLKPDFLFMVANVSRILWSRGGDIYDSEVRPHSLETSGMCFKYCNFAHALDPFLWVEPFNVPPAKWFPEGVPAKSLYTHVKLPAEDIQDFNVHGLAHYLSHPDVHVPIFRTLFGSDSFIKNDELNAARKKWQNETLAAVKLRDAMKKLGNVQGKAGDEWTDIVGKLFDYRKIALTLGLDSADGETK